MAQILCTIGQNSSKFEVYIEYSVSQDTTKRISTVTHGLYIKQLTDGSDFAGNMNVSYTVKGSDATEARTFSYNASFDMDDEGDAGFVKKIVGGTTTIQHSGAEGTASVTFTCSGSCNSAGYGPGDITLDSTTKTLTAIPEKYKVTYNANGGIGTMSASTATYNVNFKTTKNAFTRTGYKFIGWNEKADGSGTAWGITSSDNGTSESGNYWKWTYTSDITLYAQWEPYILTLNLHCNGADYVKVTGTNNGVTPCEYSGNSANNYIVTEKLKYDDYGNYGLSNGNNTSHIFMTRTGYHYKVDDTTGDGMWNTKADGSGISAHWGTRDYDTMGPLIKDLFNVDYSSSNKTLDLYIMWEAVKLTVIFSDASSDRTAQQDFYYDSPLNQFGYNSDGTPKWEMTGQFGKWQFTGYKLLGWSEFLPAESEDYEIYEIIDNDFILNRCNNVNGEYLDSTLVLYTVLKETLLTIRYHANGADYATFDKNYDDDKTTFTEEYYGEDAKNAVFTVSLNYFSNHEVNNGLANPNNPRFINITKTGYRYLYNEDNIYQWNTQPDGSGIYYRANQWKDSSEVLDTDNRGIWAKEFLGIDYSTDDKELDLYMIWVKDSPTNVMYVKHTDGNWYRGELYVRKLVDNEVIIERDINIITRTELGYRIGLIEGNTYTVQIIERDNGGTNTLNLEAYRDSSVGGFITLRHGDPNSYSGTNIEIIDGSSLGAGNSTISGDNCLYKFGEPIQTVIITGMFEKSRYAWYQAENININENDIWI